MAVRRQYLKVAAFQCKGLNLDHLRQAVNASTFSEPFTPRGVAAFARANFSWLFLAQLAIATMAAAATACFFHNGCFPTVQAAIENLPADGQIHSGQLDWNGAPQMLAEGRFFAFDVDLNHSGQFQPTTDFQIEFGAKSIRVFSWFGGYTDISYPAVKTIPFNQPELDPLWKAWHIVILFFIAIAAIVALLITWYILATIYFLPARLLGFLTNRELNLRASWKLSAAALLPGALPMIIGILLYDFGFLNLVSLLFVFGAHFVLQWLYLFFGLFFLPQTSKAPQQANPFKTSQK